MGSQSFQSVAAELVGTGFRGRQRAGMAQFLKAVASGDAVIEIRQVAAEGRACPNFLSIMIEAPELSSVVTVLGRTIRFTMKTGRDMSRPLCVVARGDRLLADQKDLLA